MDVETFENNPKALYDTALLFLTEAEAENNLLIGILSRLAAEHSADPLESFFWMIHDGPRICGVGMWMRPHDLVLSHPFPAAALAALSELLLQMRLPLPGVLGPAYAAREFAAKWTATGTLKADLWRRERIYRLQRVEFLPLTTGRMIRAEGEHLSGLTPWTDDYLRGTGENDESSAILSAAIAGGRLFIWWDGKPVSMAAWARPTPNGICVNLVYTPSKERRRGYATAVVSTLSAMLLGQGKSFCALYTDLSNPTSNSIYQRIGYTPILDCYHYRFLH